MICTKKGTIDPFCSDHHAVYIETSFIKTKHYTYKRKVWLYDQADYDSYRHHLDNCIWPEDDLPIDSLVECLTENIIKCAECSIPNKIVTIRPQDPPWFHNGIRLAIRQRTRAHHKAKKSNNPVHWATFRTLRNKVGERIPSVSVYEGSPDGVINPQELFKGKKGILFSVLGAFTPGCSLEHIPEYLQQFEKFKEEGYDLICCVAVNDPFVMAAWGKDVKAEGKIRMLADPAAEFTKALKMELDCTKPLGGLRSKRYSLVVEDAVIKSINTEPDHTGLACLLCIRNYKAHRQPS
ncbi:hypothetical protein FSP39_001408 [Pinctada imbricata]|uniref:Peroxiredoxin-5 n=1 Tax=Pinctada imbricata TaxID=66713 RepID=A0AA89BVF8_PINIB|nr:hypothetical protein FSP39_001408 [Pinctada imbricata]